MALQYWQDSTSAAGLQPGMFGYAGYWNGPFRNISSIKARFPGKPVMSYATRVNGTALYPSMHGADAIDCEPGCVDINSPYSGTSLQKCQRAALEFIKGWKGGSGLFNKPLVYCFASWITQIEDYLDRNGYARGTYYMNSSHATGRAHFCGPTTCRFGRDAADMTQYKFAGTYDQSVGQSYMLKSTPTPTPTPVPDPAKNVTGDVLRLGDHGTAVLRVQQRLWNLHYITDKARLDGQFGPVTDAAVKAFQKAAGFTAAQQDGIVGPMTWAALSHDIPNPAYVPPPRPPARPPLPVGILKLGDKSAGVKNLQWWLSHSQLKGVRGIAVDGNFGAQTETSLKNFQSYAKLTTDGIYGPKTRAALSKVRTV